MGAVLHSQAPARNSHPGTIVDARNGDPIDKADAAAYGAKDPSARGVCPQHKDQLDRRLSDVKGNFEFHIDAKYPSYFAVYCSNGYAAREVPANDNLRSGSRVVPDPVKLYPTEAKLRTEKVDPTGAARQAIARVLDDATGDFRYFRSADAQGFSRAVEELTAGDRQTANELLARPAAGRGWPIQGDLPGVAREATVRGLDDATDHLRYFANVAEGGFFAAVKLFAPAEQATIERLRTRQFASRAR